MFCLCYGALQVQVSLSTRAAVSTDVSNDVRLPHNSFAGQRL